MADQAVYCASEAAIKAATIGHQFRGGPARPGALADALIQAHHPRLGLDRSVCLRDVVDYLRGLGHTWSFAAAHELEDEFGSGS